MSENKGVVYRLIAFNRQTKAEVVVGHGGFNEICELIYLDYDYDGAIQLSDEGVYDAVVSVIEAIRNTLPTVGLKEGGYDVPPTIVEDIRQSVDVAVTDYVAHAHRLLSERSCHPERVKVERFNHYFDGMIAGFKLCEDNLSLIHEEEKSGD